MAGRPRIYDEVQIIDKAINVFWDKCYDAASADELLAAMGIGKGSFYLNFKGGKQELYEKSVKRFADKFRKKIEQEMSESGDEIGCIKQLFLAEANQSPERKNRGCYIGNALIQLSVKDTHMRKIADNVLNELRQLFAKVIRNAQEKGQIKNKDNAEVLAWHLINLWNGINVTKRMSQSPEELLSLIELNLRLLE